MEVEAAPVEAVGGHAGFGLAAGGGGAIYARIGFVLTVPDRCDAKRYRPIGGALINGGIPVVAQLVAVVFESLAEGAKHGPREMTGGAGQPVFPRERRQRVDLDGRKRSRQHGIADRK